MSANLISHLTYPLTARVVGAPQMISQPVSYIFYCSPLPSVTWRTPGLSILWCCLPTSSSVCLVFFPLSLCLARWFWPDLMNRRHVHTTAVCVSLRWSEGYSVVRFACWIREIREENCPPTPAGDLSFNLQSSSVFDHKSDTLPLRNLYS